MNRIGLHTAAALILLGSVRAGVHGEAAGLWLGEHKDACNSRRADLPGRMAEAPREIWRYGHARRDPSLALRLPGERADGTLLLVIAGDLQLFLPDGAAVWPRPVPGIADILVALRAGEGTRVLVRQGADTLLLLDAADGRVLWRWTVPLPAHQVDQWQWQPQGGRLFLFPRGGTFGYCYEFAPDRELPRLVWRRDYAGHYDANFGPAFVQADVDRDGVPEVVLAGKPACVVVVDSGTGDVKFEAKYGLPGAPPGAGRPYGLFRVTDLDADGFPDFIMASCAVEEYVAVLRNVGGKRAEPAWSRFVEKDFPADDHELRVTTESVADVDGDGRPELILGLFDAHVDARWHTYVLDPLKGFAEPKADWVDRRFLGLADVTRDGRAGVVVAVTPERIPSARERIEVLEAVSGRLVAVLDDAAPVTAKAASPGRMLSGTAFLAPSRTLLHVPVAGGRRAIVVMTGGEDRDEFVWDRAAEPSLTAFDATPLARALLESEPAVALDLRLGGQDRGEAPAVLGVQVAQAGARRELIVTRSDGSVVGGVVDLSAPGRLQEEWRVEGAPAHAWQIAPDRRLVCTADPVRDEVVIREPGAEPDVVATIPLPLPLARNGTALLPFGDAESGGLLVTMAPGLHVRSCAIYGADGRLRWKDDENGPHPERAAAADLDGDGLSELVVDDHGAQFLYEPGGARTLFAQAWHDTVPGRADGTAYALPIVGPFGPGGETRIVMSPGLMALEVLDAAGARLRIRKYDSPYQYEYSRGAPAQTRSPGRWDIGLLDRAGEFACVDLATLAVRWRRQMGCRLFAPGTVVSGDVDGDGRDEFVVGLPSGDVVALAEGDGGGRELWRVSAPTSIRSVVLADVDADGALELLVTGADGMLRVFR